VTWRSLQNALRDLAEAEVRIRVRLGLEFGSWLQSRFVLGLGIRN